MTPIYMAGPWVTELEERYVLDALRNGWYGDKAYWYVETLEREFARFHGRKYALMTPNCTTAIHLLLAGLGIRAGDEVIAPESTWIASVTGITYVGATSVFADVDPVHWCLTPATIEAAASARTKAVIVVDLFGNMPDMDAIAAWCADRKIILIEDAAEALGSTYKGRRAGGFGRASVFSFHRTKTMTTGEGGMLVLDDDELFARCKLLRDHGRAPFSYHNVEVAFKYMPFNLQAALGYGQFQRLTELVEKKRWIWEGYRRRLGDVPDLSLNPVQDGVFNSVWGHILLFGPSHRMDSERAIRELGARGVPSRPFFLPLSALPAFPGRKEDGQKRHPVAYDLYSRAINLPGALNLTDEHLDAICKRVRQLLGRNPP